MGYEFAIFALLPLGLLSFFDKELRNARGAVAGWIPLAIAGASALISGIKQKKANDAAKSAANQDNANAAAQDAAKLRVLDQLRAAGWDPAGVNTLQSGGTSSSNTRSNTRTHQIQKRLTDAAQQPMEDRLRQLVMSRLEAPQQIGASERFNAVRAINEANRGAERAIANVAGSRGLGATARGAAVTPLQIARTGQIGNYLGTVVPGLERDLATQARGEAAQFLNDRAGSEMFGNSSTVSNTSGTQSGWGQQGPDANLLLGLTSPTPRASTQTGQSALATGASSLLGGLAQWYGNRQPKTTGSLSMPDLKANPYTRTSLVGY